jgi:hypothetical protein
MDILWSPKTQGKRKSVAIKVASEPYLSLSLSLMCTHVDIFLSQQICMLNNQQKICPNKVMTTYALWLQIAKTADGWMGGVVSVGTHVWQWPALLSSSKQCMNKRMLSWQSLVYSFGPGETNTARSIQSKAKQSKAKQQPFNGDGMQ